MATKTQLKLVDPDEIRPNDENPRIHFPDISTEKLIESIDEVGVLVPVSVYEDRTKNAPPFVLIDGERRWRCAQNLGLEKIPAIVMPLPDSTQNLLHMFHIHMVREEWEAMPTAWALKKVIERTGEENPSELSKMTGLSLGIVKQLLFALSLPEQYQKMIDEKLIPINYFYELENHFIKPLKSRRPTVFKMFGAKKLIASFVDKRLNGITRDTVELRKLRAIIDVAVQEAGGPEGTSEFDSAIESLVRNKSRTIQETYEDTVEIIVEADRFARQCKQLITKFDRLFSKAQSNEDKEVIISSLMTLKEDIEDRIEMI
jgi:ParB/RepB/Spo0J family partition protein